MTVADSVEPLPEATSSIESIHRPKRQYSKAVHPSPAMYQRGCHKDSDCPSFLAGGISCRRARLDYLKERAELRRADREAAASQFHRIDVEAVSPSTTPVEPVDDAGGAAVEKLLTAVTSDPDVECTVSVLPSGGMVVVIRIPAKVVAA
ncbi:hypothetical protein [Herbiconiux sp. UC225_62]|uniref:hypothetical protein n=1 Tax=Herbiconiux sp. UC225_62 TaxID=3350168 RepID=UPI0036D3B53C